MVKYTFLLPTYKATYLAEMLDSIKRQTFLNFKVIVSDDCSPEHIKKEFDTVVSNDDRFIYRRNDTNMGGKSLVAHWNILLDLCDSPYFILATDDDIYEPEFLERLDKLINKYPEVDLARCRMASYDEKGIEFKWEDECDEIETHKDFLIDHFCKRRLKCISNFIWKTESLKQKGGFVDMPLAWFSDEITSIMMAENGCVNSKDVLFHFRDSGINISNSKPTPTSAYKKAIATLRAERWLYQYLLDMRDKERISTDTFNVCMKGRYNWAMYVYSWLPEVSFFNFCKLIPLLFHHRCFDKNRILPIVRHQLKKCITR